MPTTQAASKAEVDRESKGECLKIKSKKGAGDVYLSDRCFLVRHEILGSITVQVMDYACSIPFTKMCIIKLWVSDKRAYAK